MLNILCLFFLAFATARVTRLVVEDSITIGFRRWVIDKTGEDSGWTTLVHCPWCSGWWIAWVLTAGLFPFLDLPWWTLPLIAVGMAQLSPMILQVSDRLSVGGS